MESSRGSAERDRRFRPGAGVSDPPLSKAEGWARHTERLAVGGGFRGSRVGELVIGRTGVILKSEKAGIEVVAIRNEPEHSGA